MYWPKVKIIYIQNDADRYSIHPSSGAPRLRLSVGFTACHCRNSESVTASKMAAVPKVP